MVSEMVSEGDGYEMVKGSRQFLRGGGGNCGAPGGEDGKAGNQSSDSKLGDIWKGK